MGAFLDSLKSNIKLMQKEWNFGINQKAYLLFQTIVYRSPHVGQGPYVAGHFINNWFPAVNSFDSSITSSTDPDGAGSLQRIDSIILNNQAFLDNNGFVSFSNNLSYAGRVEYAGWPMGKDPQTGWFWTGKRMIYAPVAYSFSLLRDKI